MWSFTRKKNELGQMPSEIKDPIVDEAKRRTHAAAEAAKEGADKLNLEFVENHITLTILRTAGNRKSGR